MWYSVSNSIFKRQKGTAIIMKIVVIGCGKIGTTILKSLIAEGHDVVAIDRNPDTIAELGGVFDANYIVGNGTDCDVLEEAGISDAELLVAVTGSDEFNMLSCFLAKKMGVSHTVARIRNPEYNDKSLGFMKQNLELSMAINPDRMAATELYNILKLPGAASVESFSRRNFDMIDIVLREDSPLDNMSLIEIRKKYDANFIVCTVARGEELFIPKGDFVLHNGDRISFTAEKPQAQKLFKMLGLSNSASKSVMLLGASRIAYYLSKMLLAGGTNVKIIEQNKDRCLEVSALLPKATVIFGDGAKQELLFEEGVRDTDAFVALTGMDEENILLSYFVSGLCVPKVISKVNREEFFHIAEDLGLDTIVSPQKIVSDLIISYARALENSMGSSVETLYKLAGGKAEALEFIVHEDFEYANIPLREMRLIQDILVAGIIRGREVIIPSGNDVILPGDRIIIIAKDAGLRDLADIMA